MDRPNPSGTPGSASFHSAKFMINDQTDWCCPYTYCHAVYPDEEVTDQVTSLQKDLKVEPHLPVGEDEEGLGLENATLSPSTSSDIPSPTFSIDDVDSATATGDVNAAASDSGSVLAGLETGHMFELQDITVRFLKDGCLLSVATGPTTSGKRALLVRRRVPPLFALSQSLVWYLDGAARRDDTTTRKDRHLQQHIKGRREWTYACHVVRCSISVVEASVCQGQHPVRIPLR